MIVVTDRGGGPMTVSGKPVEKKPAQKTRKGR